MLRTRNAAALASLLRRCASTAMPPCSHQPPPYAGRVTYERALELRRHQLNTATAPYYSRPLMVHHGHMQWLWDVDGRRYLDLFGGIVTVSVGHCHPRVREAAERQMGDLWHTSNIYLYPSICEYTERLLSKFPAELNSVFFVNSGSEANDLALMLARLYTGRFEVISLRNAYHGVSPALLGVTAHSTWRYNTPTGLGAMQTMNPDPYRGVWGGSACRDSPVQPDRKCDCAPGHCSACDRYVDQLEDVLRYSAPKDGVAGMFVESIQGVGGTVQFPKDFVRRSFELVRARGGLCIADEVQTGFGRTGSHFWGFQGHGAEPDIVTMAKGIANGFPMAAVVTRGDVAACLSRALHFNTYSGGPVAGAVAGAVLDVIEEEGTQQRCAQLGDAFLRRLASLRASCPAVGDVRGKGLMVGVELVSDRAMRAPLAPAAVQRAVDGLRERGVLVGRGGFFGNVLRIKPPMCVTAEDLEFGAAMMEEVLAQC